MSNVSLSPAALADLRDIRKYIALDLNNEPAADRIIHSITKRLRQLEAYPQSGAMLSAIIDAQTGYRYLVCGKYLAFYRIIDTGVVIDRILYGGRDYIAALFGELNEE